MSDDSPFRRALQARVPAPAPPATPAEPAKPEPAVQQTSSYRWVSWAVWGVAGLIVVFVAFSVFSRTVIYEVRSDYILSSVTYLNAYGISQQQSPQPVVHDGSDGKYFLWRSPAMTVRPWASLRVSAQLAGGGLMTDDSVTYVQCVILVNGRRVADVRSQGKYAIVSCSGRA